MHIPIPIPGWKCSTGGGGYFYTGKLRSKAQPHTISCTIFGRKGTPFVYLLLTNGAPSTNLVWNFPSPLNCSKGAVFKIWINHKTRVSTVSRPWNASLSPAGPYRPKRQISSPFHILQQVKCIPFYIPEAWKRYSCRTEPPGMYTPWVFDPSPLALTGKLYPYVKPILQLTIIQNLPQFTEEYAMASVGQRKWSSQKWRRCWGRLQKPRAADRWIPKSGASSFNINWMVQFDLYLPMFFRSFTDKEL